MTLPTALSYRTSRCRLLPLLELRRAILERYEDCEAGVRSAVIQRATSLEAIRILHMPAEHPENVLWFHQHG